VKKRIAIAVSLALPLLLALASVAEAGGKVFGGKVF